MPMQLLPPGGARARVVRQLVLLVHVARQQLGPHADACWFQVARARFEPTFPPLHWGF